MYFSQLLNQWHGNNSQSYFNCIQHYGRLWGGLPANEHEIVNNDQIFPLYSMEPVYSSLSSSPYLLCMPKELHLSILFPIARI